MQQPSIHYERPPDHYERSSKIMFGLVLAMSFIILVLVAGLAMRILWWTPQPELLARNEKGENIPLLEITGKPDGKISLAFLNDLISQGFQLTHDNFQSSIPKVKPYFVGEGYASYVQTLRDIGIADRIQLQDVTTECHGFFDFGFEPILVDDLVLRVAQDSQRNA